MNVKFSRKILAMITAGTLMISSFGGLSAFADEDDGTIQYRPAFTKAEKENLPLAEGSNGSWFIEAENMKINDTLVKVFNETASEEAHMAAPVGTKKCLTPDALDKPQASIAFEVEEPDGFYIWVRHYTPEASQKSSSIGIDRQYYTQFGKMGDWTWSKSGSDAIYLDKGIHTLDYCHREAGHMVDCFIITTDSTFKPSGLGALPGQIQRPSVLSYEQRKIPRIYVGETEITSNTKTVKDGESFLVSGRRIGELLGATYTEYDDYVVFVKGRDYLKVWKDSTRAIVNGKERKLKAKAFTTENYYINIDIDILTEVFGGSYTVDTMNGQTRINLVLPPFEDEIVESDEIELTHYSEAVTYAYYSNDPNLSITAYIRNVSTSSTTWEKWYEPKYVDGAYRGTFSLMYVGEKNVIKLVIAGKDGVKTLYKTFNAFQIEQRMEAQKGVSINPSQYDDIRAFIPTAPELVLVTTFENISYYLDVEQDDDYTFNAYYREKGSNEWKKAYTPHYDDKTGQVRGSITGLKESRAYEVKVEVFKKGQKVKESQAECTMWSDNPPIAKEYKLSDIYDPDEYDGTLNLDFLKGTPDGWIKIKGVEGDRDVIASNNTQVAVLISNAEYVILENLNIQGGYAHGVLVTNGANNIRISNCEISNFGGYSVLQDDGYYTLFKDQKAASFGVNLNYVANVVVERCYIHDPHSQSSNWGYVHPQGAQGIMVRSAGGTVLRYNDIVGSNERRWDDAIGSKYNDLKTTGPARDSDYYGNFLIYSNDDTVELDGGQMNVRFYNNRVEGSYCGISLAPIMAGPTYIFRNLILNLGDQRGSPNAATKNGGGYQSIFDHSNSYEFHNTIYTSGAGFKGVGFSSLPMKDIIRATTRNNVIVTSKEGIIDKHNLVENDFDYDLFAHQDGTTSTALYADGNEKNGLFENPDFVDKTNGLFGLTEKSAGVDDGCVLDNFSDGYIGNAPDMGAIEYGDVNSKKTVPSRPIDVWADKYEMTLPKGMQETTVTVYVGEIGEETPYKIRINDTMQKWMSVTDENGKTEGVLKPNSSFTLKVKTNSDMVGENFAKGCGAFLIRLDNGYSVPFTVYAITK